MISLQVVRGNGCFNHRCESLEKYYLVYPRRNEREPENIHQKGIVFGSFQVYSNKMGYMHQEITDSGEGIMEFKKLSTYQLHPRIFWT